MPRVDQIKQQLIAGQHETVKQLTAASLADGNDPKMILDDGLLAGMEVISVQFRNHEIFLPDVLLAARAMYAGLDTLQPHLEGGTVPTKATIIIGTVEGDLHDIGKNLVGIMLRGAGYKVVDLGNSVAPADFVQAAQEHHAAVVGLSALLTTTMPAMARVIEALQRAGLAGSTKTIIGGAPVTQTFATEIGADSYGYDAARAVDLIGAWVQ